MPAIARMARSYQGGFTRGCRAKVPERKAAPTPGWSWARTRRRSR